MNYKFNDRQEYLEWCESMISQIYYANIASNNEMIKDTVSEISSTLHISEGTELTK